VAAEPKGSGDYFVSFYESGDAYSISYYRAGGYLASADQGYMHLHPGYLRGILLRILSEEEYLKIEDHHYSMAHLKLEEDAKEDRTVEDFTLVMHPDPNAQVSISDLRLAKELRPVVLKRELNSVLGRLRPPITTDRVLRWKWETLKE
jgi:hypothetical protein